MKTYRMIIRTPAAKADRIELTRYNWWEPQFDLLEETVELPEVMTVAAMQNLAAEWLDPKASEWELVPMIHRGPKYGVSTAFHGRLSGDVATVIFRAVI